MRSTSLFFSVISILSGIVAEMGAVQRVFLDFDSRTTEEEYAYNEFVRDEILAMMERDFAAFDFAFSYTTIPAAPYSTIYMNDGPPLGRAESVDFRNLSRSDTATVNIVNAGSTTQQAIVLTANVASHELGHLLGLRHHDSFGPIGRGIDPSTASAETFWPTYPGPQDATETYYSIMESDGFQVEYVGDLFFNERSAVKLSFNERGTVVAEAADSKSSRATAQAITLAPLETPNTLESGVNAGQVFDVNALVVTGRINALNEVDYYRFDGLAGDLMNFEVISIIADRITDNIDPKISLYNANGTLVKYYGEDAVNHRGFESDDAILMDVVLPTSGAYYVRVEAYNGSDAVQAERRGNYELFMYRFAALEPVLAGDYNGDGFVDAADYTVWRDAYDSGSTNLAADGDGSGAIGPGDYTVWASNFGASNSEPAAVPEPTMIVLAIGAMLTAAHRK
jgi:hypothetical protein